MVFFIAATVFALVKLSDPNGRVLDGIDWWTLLVDVW